MMIEIKNFHPNEKNEVNRWDHMGQVFGQVPIEVTCLSFSKVI